MIQVCFFSRTFGGIDLFGAKRRPIQANIQGQLSSQISEGFEK